MRTKTRCEACGAVMDWDTKWDQGNYVPILCDECRTWPIVGGCLALMAAGVVLALVLGIISALSGAA